MFLFVKCRYFGFRLDLTAFSLLVGVGSSFLFSFVCGAVGLFYGVLWLWWDGGVFELLAVLVVGYAKILRC